MVVSQSSKMTTGVRPGQTVDVRYAGGLPVCSPAEPNQSAVSGGLAEITSPPQCVRVLRERVGVPGEATGAVHLGPGLTVCVPLACSSSPSQHSFHCGESLPPPSCLHFITVT